MLQIRKVQCRYIFSRWFLIAPLDALPRREIVHLNIVDVVQHGTLTNKPRPISMSHCMGSTSIRALSADCTVAKISGSAVDGRVCEHSVKRDPEMGMAAATICLILKLPPD